jgi:zinc transport system permease protein
MFDLSIFALPFMQRALIGGVLVAGVTSVVGVFAILRRASFYGDAIAHASLTGIAVSLLLGLNPLGSALTFSIFLGMILPKIEQASKLHIDAILGFLLPFSMAVSILLLSLIPGYQPDLITYLFGSILAISPQNLIIIGLIAILTVVIVYFKLGKLLATAFDPVYAGITGINVKRYQILHNILLSLAIVPSISLVGVILATALLIIPAAIARQFAHSLSQLFIFTPIIAITTTVLGIFASAMFNLPTGPAIVILLGTVFIAASLVKKTPA